MKLLKMHDNADGKFDRFVKEQLDKTDVDKALADRYFAQMKLPTTELTPPQKRRRHWFFVWFAAGCLVAITAYLLITSDEKTPASLPKKSNNTVGLPSTPSKPPAPSTTTNSVGDKVAAQTTQQATAPVMPIDNGQINKTLTKNRAALQDPPLSLDTGLHSKTNKLEQPITINDTVPIPTAQRDSAAKLLRKTVVPPKAKDSVYIIW
jgi:hypothetical protein